MALFFDAAWFKARLAALNLQKEDMARAVGWTQEELALVFKDQMEVQARDVELLSALLDVPASEIADRCGISTPISAKQASQEVQIERLIQRVATLEAKVAALELALKDR